MINKVGPDFSRTPSGSPNKPFENIVKRTWGRAQTNATDPKGLDPDEDYNADGPDKLTVIAKSSQGLAKADATGTAELTYSSEAVSCDSAAWGDCNMASDTTPPAPTRSEFNCRTRTELASSNLHDTDSVKLLFKFEGERNPESLGKKTVEGWAEVIIIRANDDIETYRVEVIPAGWRK